MILHVRYNSLSISLPSSAKQQREMTNSALSELLFQNSISNLLRCPRFSFAVALTVINKVNDFKSTPRLVGKIEIHFLIDDVFGVAVVRDAQRICC